jgi:hypothetical protein
MLIPRIFQFGKARKRDNKPPKHPPVLPAQIPGIVADSVGHRETRRWEEARVVDEFRKKSTCSGRH